VNLATGRADIVGQLPTSYAHAMATVRDGQVFPLGGPRLRARAMRSFVSTRPPGVSPAPARCRSNVADGGVATIGDTTYILGGINGGPLTVVCAVRIG
jgi:hypothetical protein